jgi:asparagine synthetase B (glutamine-hydrolysing)
MCGILFNLKKAHLTPTEDDTLLHDEIARRGPDSIATHHIDLVPSSISQDLHLTFTSSVLSLRGPNIVKQPLVDDRYVFCWNGQVLRGLDVDLTDNDTLHLWEAILAGRNISDVLSQIEGP